MRLELTLVVLPFCLIACNTPEAARSVDGPHEEAPAVPLTATVRTEKPDGSLPYRAPAVLPDAGQPDGSIDGGELGVDPSTR